MSRSYMEDSLECALEEAGVTVTPEQFKDIAVSLAISAENESMATGRDCIPHPLQTEIERVKRDSKAAVSRAEVYGDKALAEANRRIDRLVNLVRDLERKLEQAA